MERSALVLGSDEADLAVSFLVVAQVEGAEDAMAATLSAILRTEGQSVVSEVPVSLSGVRLDEVAVLVNLERYDCPYVGTSCVRLRCKAGGDCDDGDVWRVYYTVRP